MKPVPGPRPSRIKELARAEDRLSFIYLERCVVHRDNNAITATDDRGVIHIPAATIGALLLGPGTRVTHHAMSLLADAGATAVWVGERGVRYYAHGRGTSTSTRLLEAQALASTTAKRRLAVARAMYEMRFPNEDVSRLTMQQLRGREGARVRAAYRQASETYGVPWSRRDFRPDDFTASDAVNQALSAATTCLYGVTHAVIVALGCSPGLGFIHAGHSRSFVFDIADLYKAELAIPVAFAVAALGETEDVGAITRHRMRDALYDGALLGRCARDIRKLLLPIDSAEDAADDWDVVSLWDDRGVRVVSGHNYDDTEDLPW